MRSWTYPATRSRTGRAWRAKRCRRPCSTGSIPSLRGKTRVFFDDAAVIQRLQDAVGTTINQDDFSVVVEESDLPGGMSPEAYREQIRTNLNDDICGGPDLQGLDANGCLDPTTPEGWTTASWK